MADLYKVVRYLLNAAIFNDFEWPWQTNNRRSFGRQYLIDGAMAIF